MKKRNPYADMSNQDLLSDLKGFKSGKFHNLRYPEGKTTYAYARDELAKRKVSGKISKQAGKPKPQRTIFGLGMNSQGFGTPQFGIRLPKPPKRGRGIFGF